MVELPLAGEIVTRATLTYWAMSAYQGLFWNGLAFHDGAILECLGVLWTFAIAATGLALRRYRRSCLGA
jgi:hypothetical protein